MTIKSLEITGIRLIGFYFLFTTSHHMAGALMAAYYEVHDPSAESFMAAISNAATITQTILTILVLSLSLVSMLHPQAIQKLWRKIDTDEKNDTFTPESLTLFRMAALMMALFFGQQTLANFIQIAMISNISFAGFNAHQTISYMVFMVMSLYLFIKPEVINRWK